MSFFYSYTCCLTLRRELKNLENFLKNCPKFYHSKTIFRFKHREKTIVCYNTEYSLEKVKIKFSKSKGDDKISEKRKHVVLENIIEITIWFDPNDSVPRILGKVIISRDDILACISHGRCREPQFVMEQQNEWIRLISDVMFDSPKYLPKICSRNKSQWISQLRYVLDTFFICPFQKVINCGFDNNWLIFTRYCPYEGKYSSVSDIYESLSGYIDITTHTDVSYANKKRIKGFSSEPMKKFSKYLLNESLFDNNKHTILDNEDKIMRMFVCNGAQIKCLESIDKELLINVHEKTAWFHNEFIQQELGNIVKELFIKI